MYGYADRVFAAEEPRPKLDARALEYYHATIVLPREDLM